MNVTLRQLEIFAAVSNTCSVTDAAKELGLTQPAVSTTLGQLELTIGQLLFDRVDHRLILNDLGRALLPAAIEVCARATELQTRATRRADGTSLGELRVGASTTVGNYLLPVIIGGFLTRHPDVAITLEVMKTRAVLNELREFRIDLALVEGYCRDKDFETHVWQRDRLCIVASPRHPLAGKKTASLNDLAKAKRWILRELGSSARTVFEAAIAKNVRQIEIFMELGNNEAIKTAVANDLGISCLSHLAVKPLLDSGALVEIPVPNLDLTRNLHIVVHKHKYLTKLLNSFVEFCQNSTAPCDVVVSGHSRAAKSVMARRS